VCVCAKTGEPANCLLPVRVVYTPRRTWLLLLFGGFWAFLIGRGFTTEETIGLVPFSQAVLARLAGSGMPSPGRWLTGGHCGLPAGG
jgi:hypothetical protein